MQNLGLGNDGINGKMQNLGLENAGINRKMQNKGLGAPWMGDAG